MCFGHLSHLKMTERTHSCSHPATLLLCHLIGKTLTDSERSNDAGRLASKGCWKKYHAYRRPRGSERFLLNFQRWVQCRPQPCRYHHQAPCGLQYSPQTRLRYSALLNLLRGEDGSGLCRYLSICFLGLANKAWRDTPEVRVIHGYCARLLLHYFHYWCSHRRTSVRTSAPFLLALLKCRIFYRSSQHH